MNAIYLGDFYTKDELVKMIADLNNLLNLQENKTFLRFEKRIKDYMVKELKEIRSLANRYFKMYDYDAKEDTIIPIIEKVNEILDKWELV